LAKLSFNKLKKMNDMRQAILDTTNWLQAKGFQKPAAGIVFGTGLGALAEKIDITLSVSYSDIPHFPVSTVEFHKGNLLYGHITGVPVIVMQGRFHYYEGYSMQQITFPVRVMKELGIEYLLLSNAAGGLNLSYKKGDLVIIEDHINLLPDNPLRGMNDPEMGNRFADMSCPYDKRLRQLLKDSFNKQGIIPKEGIYVAVQGPSLETRAEYRWLRNMGADIVGMSTVPEVIVAAQMGLPCAAVSVITDECDPDNLQPVNIGEIIEILGRAGNQLSDIFIDLVINLR
jgi:purine-nucleoside phosphorylase